MTPPTRGIRKIRDELDQGRGGEALPRVSENEDLACCGLDAGVEGERLAAGGDLITRTASASWSREGASTSAVPSVEPSDTTMMSRAPGIREIEKVREAGGQPRRFVARGEDDRDRGPGVGGKGALRAGRGESRAHAASSKRVAQVYVDDY